MYQQQQQHEPRFVQYYDIPEHQVPYATVLKRVYLAATWTSIAIVALVVYITGLFYIPPWFESWSILAFLPWTTCFIVFCALGLALWARYQLGRIVLRPVTVQVQDASFQYHTEEQEPQTDPRVTRVSEDYEATHTVVSSNANAHQ